MLPVAVSLLQQCRPEEQKSLNAPLLLGIAYACLGRVDDAIREGKMGVELLPVSKEAMNGATRVRSLAQIYVMTGEYDAAVDQLEFLLSRPGELSVALLRIDPIWDPLREHPRFQRLLEGRL